MDEVKKIALCGRIMAEQTGNSEKFAERELAVMRATGDEMNVMMADNLEELMLVFATQGHSGFSASYALQAFSRLADFKPLSPLTGKDDEWNEVGDGMFQNKRCPTVFKENGKAYDSQGRVFKEGDAYYTSRDSRVDITFPYVVPEKPEVVEREERDVA